MAADLAPDLDDRHDPLAVALAQHWLSEREYTDAVLKRLRLRQLEREQLAQQPAALCHATLCRTLAARRAAFERQQSADSAAADG